MNNGSVIQQTHFYSAILYIIHHDFNSKKSSNITKITCLDGLSEEWGRPWWFEESSPLEKDLSNEDRRALGPVNK